MAKKKLGIDALFQTSVPAASSAPRDTAEFFEAAVDAIDANPRQPRRYFDADGIAQLAASIRAQGVLQPLLVRRGGEGRFELIAGERRLRAAREAGLGKVPVRVVALSDAESLVAAVVENLQREDLNPIEEAEGYLELLRARLDEISEYDTFRDAENALQGPARVLRALNNRVAGNSKDNVVLTLEPAVREVFEMVGKLSWQSFATHRLPLLTLPPEIAAALRENKIPYTKARGIARATAERLGVDETSARHIRRDLIARSITENLSVRGIQAEIERLVGGTAAPAPAARAKTARPRAQGLEGRIADLTSRLTALQLDELGPDKRREVQAAVEQLLSLL